jgi:ABC-type dipeptide/oligopeptide/nickel transport system ATPase component
MTHPKPPLLEILDLSVCTSNAFILKDVSLRVNSNEIFALVGESGSGKSLLAKSIMGLLPSKALKVNSGSITFLSHPLLQYSESKLRALRGKEFCYIPQSPLCSLNPIMSIGRQLTEGYHSQDLSASSAKDRAYFLLKRVGFHNPEVIYKSCPHQLSGGMRQRVLIAMALMNSPRLLIADEPTTALDVTLQAEIVELLLELKDECGLGILFITHDLGIVAKAASRIVILQNGRTIEEGSVDEIFFQPRHDYTKKLLHSLMPHPTLAGIA